MARLGVVGGPHCRSPLRQSSTSRPPLPYPPVTGQARPAWAPYQHHEGKGVVGTDGGDVGVHLDDGGGDDGCDGYGAVSYTHLRAHETPEHLVCRLLLEKKKQ
eukprot:TRINITY_DN40343_c0_g1_i1.p1 TRINITY_DN40343_c0_g1~~TRINITY_DN40343_c0_g1_i1.p1  ORF type:complete len:103 (-),score=24.90 TRINITY_DN40343_c0_g1_i1:76-384(-)